MPRREKALNHVQFVRCDGLNKAVPSEVGARRGARPPFVLFTRRNEWAQEPAKWIKTYEKGDARMHMLQQQCNRRGTKSNETQSRPRENARRIMASAQQRRAISGYSRCVRTFCARRPGTRTAAFQSSWRVDARMSVCLFVLYYYYLYIFFWIF